MNIVIRVIKDALKNLEHPRDPWTGRQNYARKCLIL